MAFKTLAEMRKGKGEFGDLMKEVEKLASGGFEDKNEGFWQPTVDKAKNGSAVIRFLAPVKGEELPWVRRWDHGFKGPTGKYYIELCRTSLGSDTPDPVVELNSDLWNNGINGDIEAGKTAARDQKRRLHYISNILVIKDPGNPENNGKVFLFKYGKKIFDKIKSAMNPTFEDEVAINPFDFWTGANFKLKIMQVEGYRNYDKSEFDAVSKIADTDKEIEAIWEQEKPLLPFIDPSAFKSYDELKRKLDAVLGVKGSAPKSKEPEEEAPEMKSESAPAPKSKAAKAPKEEEDDDQGDSYFKNLAAD
jgi:hypothetical protein